MTAVIPGSIQSLVATMTGKRKKVTLKNTLNITRMKMDKPKRTRPLYLVDRVYDIAGWSKDHLETLRDELERAIEIVEEEIDNG